MRPDILTTGRLNLRWIWTAVVSSKGEITLGMYSKHLTLVCLHSVSNVKSIIPLDWTTDNKSLDSVYKSLIWWLPNITDFYFDCLSFFVFSRISIVVFNISLMLSTEGIFCIDLTMSNESLAFELAIFTSLATVLIPFCWRSEWL